VKVESQEGDGNSQWMAPSGCGFSCFLWGQGLRILPYLSPDLWVMCVRMHDGATVV